MTAHTLPHETIEQARALEQAKSRLLYLDNIRTALIILVVLGHLSISYGVNADWVYIEGGEVDPLVAVLQVAMISLGAGFAMGLLFLISGYFAAAAYERRGPHSFLRERLRRLGMPWLFYMIAINPLIHYAVEVKEGEYRVEFWQYLLDFHRTSGRIAEGPIWFVEALLIFSIVYALWRTARGRQPDPGNSARQAKDVPPSSSIALFALVMGLMTFLIRVRFTAFVHYEPLHLEIGRMAHYIALFIAGTWAYQGDWLSTIPERQARFWQRIAFGFVLVLPPLLTAFGGLSGSLDPQALNGWHWMSLVYSLWEAFFAVSMAITVLTFFRQHLNAQGPLARTLSENSFAVYVLHPAVIVPLSLLLSGIRMNLTLKFWLVGPVAVLLCYLVAYGVRRVPYIRSIL